MKTKNTRAAKKNGKTKNHVTTRMNVLFFGVFLLFSLLILRLGIVQIVNGEDYTRELERTEEITVDTSVPRGKIFDRNGNVIVDNEPVNSITYTKTQQTKTDEMLEVAERLAGLIEMDTSKVTERDIQDFWILTNPEEAEAKVTEEEKTQLDEGDLEQSDYDQLIRERITEDELATIEGQTLESLAIFREMQSGYNLSQQTIKNKDVTDEEFAVVSENLSSLPGVDTTVDWNRVYPYGDVLRSILGNVRSIPEDKVEYYLSRGYSRNDRVGVSYLELQYEEILQGQKSKVKTVTDKAGNVIDSEMMQEGERGKDLVLSIDIELQQELEKILEEEILRLKAKGSHPLFDRSFIVMTDPMTGELLAMAGKQYDEESGDVIDYSMGAYTSSYEIGSSVKGATVLAGYQDGVITPGSTLVDEPIRIQGSEPKSSWFNRGGTRPMTDAFALEKSSNSYMFKIAIAMAGANYQPGQPIDFPYNTYERLRNYYRQFGLGAETGIDLPGETVGIQPTQNLIPGNLLDLSIGQFDTYTALQMAQYVSTIANDGNRLQPMVVKEIRDPSIDNSTLGPLVQENRPNILNKLNNTQAEIDQVKRGFFGSFNGSDGTGRQFSGQGYNAAGKTGTAEVVYFGPKYRDQYLGNPPETTSSTLIGYAPVEKPEVAFSVLSPWVYESEGVREDMNQILGTKAIDAYYDLKEKRLNEGTDNEESDVDVAEEAAEDVAE